MSRVRDVIGRTTKVWRDFFIINWNWKSTLTGSNVSSASACVWITGRNRKTRPPGRSSYRPILERLPYFRGSEMGSSIAAPKFPIGGTDYPTGTHRLRSSFIMWRPTSRGLWIKTPAIRSFGSTTEGTEEHRSKSRTSVSSYLNPEIT